MEQGRKRATTARLTKVFRLLEYPHTTPGALFYDNVNMEEFHKEYARQKATMDQLRIKRNHAKDSTTQGQLHEKLRNKYREILSTLVKNKHSNPPKKPYK